MKRSLKWFQSLRRGDFTNGAVLNEIADVFKQRDHLLRLLAHPCRFPTKDGPCANCEACVDIIKALEEVIRD